MPTSPVLIDVTAIATITTTIATACLILYKVVKHIKVDITFK